MEIRITRNTGKPHIICYERDNGTTTWMKASDFFVQHDLSHFALEKTLRYTTAFMGLLNNGMDIHDFENREKRGQINITQEACYAENMANLFLMETTRGPFDRFNEVLAAAFTDMQHGFATPVLLQNDIEAVRSYLNQLVNEWKALPAGETMILEYKMADG